MNEVKSPKKPLIYYYMIVVLLVLLFNLLAMPWLAEHQIKEVDYNTFVSMTEKNEIGQVEIQEQSNRILFTSTDGKTIYKTAIVPDDGLVQRLLDAGISTTGEEIEQTSLLMDILGWVLPLVIFIAIGQIISRSLMKKMGGGNSMMFNMGKSDAKVYVKSAEGIKFADVAGEDEAKENLTGDRQLPPRSHQVSGDRRVHAQGRAAGGPSGHRQDHAGQGCGRRGQRALLLHVRLGVRGDVRGHGRVQGARPVQAGQGESSLHRVHRRDRRHRPEAQRRPVRRQRRARADAEPAAHRDGRLRGQHRRHHSGRHQPSRVS